MDSKLDVGTILRSTLALLVSVPLPALVALLLVAGPSIAIDITAVDSNYYLGVSLASLFVQYGVTNALLSRLGLIEPGGQGKAGAFMLILFVTTLAIVAGLLLLILPGLFLAARWSITVPLVIAEGRTMSDSLHESSVRTKAHIVPLMLALALLFVPEVGALACEVFSPSSSSLFRWESPSR